MSDIVIRAESLSKKYLIGHQSAGRERYTALRDVIGRSIRGHARSALALMRGQQMVTGDEIEEFWALRDVSFEIKRGEAVGIVGRNGAGKSTLLKILSRITEPTSGRVEIMGRVASLLEVGTGFHPELTGRENIYLNGAILGMSRAEIRKKFDEIVAFGEVEQFLDTPVKRYSSGMYVRLAFAVAAHLEPEILVVDEVLAVGDAQFQKKCLGKMRDVAGKGRTVLFVSHNIAAIASLCQSGMVLDRGQMMQRGPASSCIERYLWPTKLGGAIEAPSRHLREAMLFLNEHGAQPTETVAMGAPLGCRLSFTTPEKTHSPRVGLVLKQVRSGEAVFGINSEMLGVAPVPTPSDKFQVTFWFDKLNLVQGCYVFDLHFGVRHELDFEVVENCLSFVVTEADIYGSGRLPYETTGPIYVHPKVKLTAGMSNV